MHKLDSRISGIAENSGAADRWQPVWPGEFVKKSPKM
jgi:hypothetical protein